MLVLFKIKVDHIYIQPVYFYILFAVSPLIVNN